MQTQYFSYHPVWKFSPVPVIAAAYRACPEDYRAYGKNSQNNLNNRQFFHILYIDTSEGISFMVEHQTGRKALMAA